MKQQLRISIGQMLLTLVFGLFFNLSWGQSNPETATLPYSFTGATSLPSTLAVHRFGTNSASIPTARTTSEANGDLALVTNANSGGYMMQGADGISLLASGSQAAGAIVVEISTTDKANINVSWTAWTILDQNSRTNSIALQYRVGNSGVWIDADSPISSVYSTSTVGRNNGVSFTQVLPAAVDDEPIVQIRWIYWDSAGTTGSRDRLGIDEIEIDGDDAVSTDPSLTTDPALLTFSSPDFSAVSAPESVSVNAANLTGDITVNAPANFQLSLNQTDWLSEIVLANAGTITDQPLWVRFAPVVAGNVAGDVIFSGGGLSSSVTLGVEAFDPNAIPCFEETFAGIPGNNTTTSGSSTAWDGNANFPSAGNTTVYQAGEAIRLGSGSSTGTLTSKSLENLVGNLRVSFDVKGWTNVEGSINVTLGGTTQNYVYTATRLDAFERVELDFQNVVANSTLVLQTSSGRAFVTNVSVCTISETSTTWNGTEWTNGLPTASVDAIIEANYTTSNGLSEAKSLTLNSGVLTIASGTSLTIENEIVNNAGATNFVVASGANLIQTENVSNVGAITVMRNSAPIVRLDHTLWSSPVANQNIFDFSPETLTNRFYTYDTATDNYINTGLNAASVFEGGRGYGIRAPNNFQTTPAAEWTGYFVGIPHNGAGAVPISNLGNGFNLVGNPYPSALSASAVVGGNPNITGTLYFYAHSLGMDANGQFPAGTNYALWNASGSTSATDSSVEPNGTIQVGQGFIVKATTAGNMEFNNTMRSNNVANQFFRQANNEVEKHRIWLNLTNSEGAFNQMLVAYIEGASNETDRDFDGEAFGNSGSFIASKISNKNYTIQGRALPFSNEDVVAMNFHAATAGNFTISLSQFDGIFAADQAVYIKDNQTGATHDLKSAPYTFTTGTGDFNDRFQIVYRSALSTDKPNFNENGVIAYVNNNALTIQTKNVEMKNISIYDLRGRMLFNSANVNGESFTIPNFSAQNQVLMVKVTSTENEVATVKVIF